MSRLAETQNSLCDTVFGINTSLWRGVLEKAFYDMKGRTNAHVAICFLSGMQTCGGHLVMKGWPVRLWARVIHTHPSAFDDRAECSPQLGTA